MCFCFYHLLHNGTIFEDLHARKHDPGFKHIRFVVANLDMQYSYNQALFLI